ncbi:MAG TPA: NAD(P)H-dependent oxidoreductase [Acidimicrobiales bacterium]
MSLVVVHAGESATSRTRALAVAALELGGGGELVELTQLSADGLLGRTADPEVEAAVAAASNASILVLASPVYRATVAGPLKAFLDRFPTGALAGTAVVLAATAGSRDHYLSLDTSGRALVASLDGWSVPTVVYATSADIVDGKVSAEIQARLEQALTEAASVTASVTATPSA